MNHQSKFQSSYINLLHVASVPLTEFGDCWLLGITPQFTLYVEESASQDEDSGIIRHAFHMHNAVLERVETPAELPAEMVKPRTGNQTSALNYSGPRYKGLREAERITDLVLPLTVDEKIQATQALQLPVAPPMVLGLAESYVLAETQVAPDTFLVCRRLRLAYALPQPEVELDNTPYDYDTAVLYRAHLYNSASDDPLSFGKAFAGLPGERLYRPMDCLAYGDYVFVADGGEHGRRSAIHLWRIRRNEAGQGESA